MISARGPRTTTCASRVVAFVAICVAFLLGGTVSTVNAAAQPVVPVAATAFLRVDQLGFLAAEKKIAWLLAPTDETGLAFRVVRGDGRTVERGTARASRGPWNGTFGAVNPLVFTDLRAAGRYRVEVPSLGIGSPWFSIGTAHQLFAPRVADAVDFFQAQRDGSDVISGPLHRKPSHLNDANAALYAWPTYESPDSDVIVGSSLKQLAGDVDLEGGWFDAGDFLKFTHTTAYAVVLMFAAVRAMGDAAPASLLAEARFGLDWLRKAWDPKQGVLYLQVGIGSGNQQGTFNGDHDLWRLPERDDSLAGSTNRYLRNRPAFRANDPGTPLPPNLAGRVAAAFALAAQVDAASLPARARSELSTAEAIYTAAKKTNVTAADVVTALPHAFYPESSWRDDLELATAEITRGEERLGHGGEIARHWLGPASHWAIKYLEHEAGHDTLNLYDTSALAHADLIDALHVAEVNGHTLEHELLADLREQLDAAQQRAKSDPFRAGAVYSDFDAVAHTFGLVTTAALYQRLTGSHRYESFATAQRDWALGANPWGVSMMVGVGTTFPDCMQHVVANLSGSVDGTPPIVRGAVVNGPNDEALFKGGLGEFFDNGRTCPANGVDRYRQFTGHGSRFVDDVRSWQTVEPSLDFTAIALLAFALSS